MIQVNQRHKTPSTPSELMKIIEKNDICYPYAGARTTGIRIGGIALCTLVSIAAFCFTPLIIMMLYFVIWVIGLELFFFYYRSMRLNIFNNGELVQAVVDNKRIIEKVSIYKLSVEYEFNEVRYQAYSSVPNRFFLSVKLGSKISIKVDPRSPKRWIPYES
ncbi:MAG: hypothetical protein COA78_02600 [Blastopirellula sp.]|nr:MAG: hypothetical protein COA78_02600 [Blastopirellula sp.]